MKLPVVAGADSAKPAPRDGEANGVRTRAFLIARFYHEIYSTRPLLRANSFGAANCARAEQRANRGFDATARIVAANYHGRLPGGPIENRDCARHLPNPGEQWPMALTSNFETSEEL